MHDLLPSSSLLIPFLAASFVLAVTPGPGVLYIVTRSLAQGRASGLASVAGVAAGNLGNAIGASIGLAALFAVSSLAFTVVKYLGALYLIFLGVQTLRARPVPADRSGDAVPGLPLRRIFLDGLVVALLNPKTALFFAAFLPQFLGDPAAPLQRTLALGALFVLIAALTDSAYALMAGSVRPWLGRASGIHRAGRLLTGGAFIGLGLMTALGGPRTRN